MIDYKNFAKSITEIFNSEFPLRFKYDQTTRIVCEVLKAETVSLLLYDSKQDALICKGCYLNPKEAKLRLKNKELKSILNNISIYEFLKFKRQPKSNLDCVHLYKDYSQNITALKSVTQEIFSSTCNEFKKNFQLFDAYKNIFQKEKYIIDNKTITGEYFNQLLKLEKSYSVKVKICDLSKYSSSQKQCCVLLKDELGIQIEENGFYIGLPLYATERYFGILRILYPKKTIFIIRDTNGEYKLNDVFQERLGYFSQLISLHLETNYYLEGYKKLSLINETITSETTLNLNNTCEILSGVVNCNGTFIRLFNTETNQPEITGFTKTLHKYIEFLKDYHDELIPNSNKFSVSLVALFKEDASIVAVSFDTDANESRRVKVFTIDDDNNIKDSYKNIDITDLKSKSYKEELDRLNMKQITVVPVPYISDSYMIFSNTKNRKFITADVEMIILAVKGIGLEIKHIRDSEKIINQQQAVVQTESIRNVVHQVGAPLNGILLHVANLVAGRLGEAQTKTRLFYVFQMIKHSMRQLKRFQRILELDTLPIVPNKKKIINLPKYLIGKSIEFQSISASKGIRIHAYTNTNTNLENAQIDDELFEEVINNLIDNAVKYSFNAAELKSYGIKYDETNRKSMGNILIYYSIAIEQIIISVTNWGAIIYGEELEKIFERHYRGRGANKFSLIGSGIGLFLVKRILDAMDARIEVLSQNNKTTFTITFKT